MAETKLAVVSLPFFFSMLHYRGFRFNTKCTCVKIHPLQTATLRKKPKYIQSIVGGEWKEVTWEDSVEFCIHIKHAYTYYLYLKITCKGFLKVNSQQIIFPFTLICLLLQVFCQCVGDCCSMFLGYCCGGGVLWGFCLYDCVCGVCVLLWFY